MASQIVMRESLIEIIEYISTVNGEDDSGDIGSLSIQNHREQVVTLASTILKSFPQLLGFTYRHEGAPQTQISLQGRMVGRLFALFSMWVVQRAKSTSEQQKQTASEVVAWINLCHGLS